jgi:hypothetical protein
VLSVRYDETGFAVEAFLALAQRIWPRDYDVARAAEALEHIPRLDVQ